MSIHNYFASYFLLLIAAAVIISGWFLITRGEIRKMPDGTEIQTGNIFKAWYFFWMKEVGEKRYWYNLESLAEFVFLVRPYIGSRHIEVFGQEHPIYGFPVVVDADMEDKAYLIEREMQVNLTFLINPDIPAGRLLMYICKKDPVYRFPEWIRKMMAACITCHASFYGSLIFVGFHALCSKDDLHHFYAFVPDNLFDVAIVMTWIAYSFSLSYILTYLYKKL